MYYLTMYYLLFAYFRKNGMDLSAHYLNRQTFSWRENLTDLIKRLTPGMFVQCHKSYIVNLDHIQELRWADDLIVLENGEELPISRRRVNSLRELMTGKRK